TLVLLSKWHYHRGVYRCNFCNRPLKGSIKYVCDCRGIVLPPGEPTRTWRMLLPIITIVLGVAGAAWASSAGQGWIAAVLLVVVALAGWKPEGVCPED